MTDRRRYVRLSPRHAERRSPERDGGYRLAFAAYEQVSGVLGAVALAAFLSHFIEFDWRGALAQLFGVWDSAVRPAVKLLIEATIVPIFAWCFRWHINIPLPVRDYISVGIVLCLSGIRSERSSLFVLFQPIKFTVFNIAVLLPVSIFLTIIVFAAIVMSWPLLLVGVIIVVGPVGEWISMAILRWAHGMIIYMEDHYWHEKEIPTNDSWNGEEISHYDSWDEEESARIMRKNRPDNLRTCIMTLTPIFYLALAILVNYLVKFSHT